MMRFTARRPERRLGHTHASSQSAAEMTKEWHGNPRWMGTKRPYSAQQVVKLRASIQVEHTLARLGAERLWYLLRHEEYVHALGALTGNQAVRSAGGAESHYLSGWQVAADANNAGQMYPDQSLYPADSVSKGDPGNQTLSWCPPKPLSSLRASESQPHDRPVNRRTRDHHRRWNHDAAAVPGAIGAMPSDQQERRADHRQLPCLDAHVERQAAPSQIPSAAVRVP